MCLNILGKTRKVITLESFKRFLCGCKIAAVLGKNVKNVGVCFAAISLIIIVREHNLALWTELMLFAANYTLIRISTGHSNDLLY
jgi:hypothetical protein